MAFVRWVSVHCWQFSSCLKFSSPECHPLSRMAHDHYLQNRSSASPLLILLHRFSSSIFPGLQKNWEEIASFSQELLSMAQTYQRLQTSIKSKERVITELVDRTNELDYRTCKDYTASKDELKVRL